MKKRLIPAFILLAYSAFLIKVMVFKDLPVIRIGKLMLNFGGTDGGHPANFVPFTTIVPYLLGYKGLIIAGINLVGNVVLLVPIGFLIPLLFPNIAWKKCLVLAIATGLAIEIMQTVLRVGIFDIDDVILNALGVMIGYAAITILAKWVREKKYIHILIAAIVAVAATIAFYAAVVYPISHQPVSREGEIPQSGDLCGGTGGNGQIVSVGENTIVMKRKDGSNQIVKLTNQTKIRTSTGSDLKTGDRITLVGGPNPDGSFTAEAVFVCGVSRVE